MAQSFTQHVAARRGTSRIVLRALRTKSILFSAIARRHRTVSPRMAKRHGRRASRSRRGIKDRLRGIDDERREQSRPRAVIQWATTTTTREGNVRDTRACFSPERKPYTPVYKRQLYSRRKIVSAHARARDAIRAHTAAHAARADIRERNADNGPDCKIWNDFVGARATVT